MSESRVALVTGANRGIGLEKSRRSVVTFRPKPTLRAAVAYVVSTEGYAVSAFRRRRSHDEHRHRACSSFRSPLFELQPPASMPASSTVCCDLDAARRLRWPLSKWLRNLRAVPSSSPSSDARLRCENGTIGLAGRFRKPDRTGLRDLSRPARAVERERSRFPAAIPLSCTSAFTGAREVVASRGP